MTLPPFKAIARATLLGTFLSLIGPGCRAQPDDPAVDSVETGSADADAGLGEASSSGLGAAQAMLKAGQVDEAAARLAQMQLHGATFDAAEAREFRQTYAEAYERALDAIQRGDPRGEVALRLLRAAAPR